MEDRYDTIMAALENALDELNISPKIQDRFINPTAIWEYVCEEEYLNEVARLEEKKEEVILNGIIS